MTTDSQYDVFLGHSTMDAGCSRRCGTVAGLRKDELKVWFDEWVLNLGDRCTKGHRGDLFRARAFPTTTEKLKA